MKIIDFSNPDFLKLLRPMLIQFSKFNNFLWVCWFLGKNLSNFVPLVWKLHNGYCHTVYAFHFRALLLRINFQPRVSTNTYCVQNVSEGVFMFSIFIQGRSSDKEMPEEQGQKLDLKPKFLVAAIVYLSGTFSLNISDFFHLCLIGSERPKPLFWFRSDTETETLIGRYFRPIPKPIPKPQKFRCNSFP